MSEMLQAALRYAERDIRVTPLHYIRTINGESVCSCFGQDRCKVPGKHPMIKSWQSTATIEPEMLETWWRLRPLANIGLPMGGPQRLVAIDLDGTDGMSSLQNIEANYDRLPETLTQTTGRPGGGEHRLFRLDDRMDITEVRNRVGSIASGIDIRSEGGLIVGSPSMHVSGRRYEWRNLSVDIALLPTWFYDVVRKGSVRRQSIDPDRARPTEDALPSYKTRRDRARSYLAKCQPSIQGRNGSRALMKAAVALVRGFCIQPDDAAQILWDDFNPRCRPSWSYEEIAHKVEDAEYGSNREWGHLLLIARQTTRSDQIVDAIFAGAPR
jgi:Bifunctional DNA primase/polymerase, N-terminal